MFSFGEMYQTEGASFSSQQIDTEGCNGLIKILRKKSLAGDFSVFLGKK